jgi:hypothetical protein
VQSFPPLKLREQPSGLHKEREKKYLWIRAGRLRLRVFLQGLFDEFKCILNMRVFGFHSSRIILISFDVDPSHTKFPKHRFMDHRSGPSNPSVLQGNNAQIMAANYRQHNAAQVNSGARSATNANTRAMPAMANPNMYASQSILGGGGLSHNGPLPTNRLSISSTGTDFSRPQPNFHQTNEIINKRFHANMSHQNDAPRFDASDFPALGDGETSQKVHLIQRSPRNYPNPNDEYPALTRSSSPLSDGYHPSSIHDVPQIRYSAQHQHSESSSASLSQLESSHHEALHLPQLIPMSYQPQSFHQHQISNQSRLHESNLSSQAARQAPVKQMEMSGEVDYSPASRFGLKGLLKVIGMTDPDLNTLALGQDLTSLGLNLTSTDVLHASFAYPCMDVPTKKDPDFVLPFCYYMRPPQLKTSRLKTFQLETLFYIFYNMPKDALQIFAAKELYARDWFYQKESKLWLTRVPLPNLPPGSAGGVYEYFDINSWERKYLPQGAELTLPGGFVLMTQEELDALSKRLADPS